MILRKLCMCGGRTVSKYVTRRVKQAPLCSRLSTTSGGVPSEDLVRRRILEEPNRTKMIQRLQRIENRIKPTEPKENRLDAGVLMPLCIVDGKLSFLLTLRSATLATHAGQVSFPGGRLDHNDSSIEDAALRETEEELGIPKSSIEVWSRLTSMPDRAGKYKVTPVLGYLGELNMDDLKPNAEEVSHTFATPLTHLLSPTSQRYTLFRNGFVMPVFVNSDVPIWGMTAILIDVFLANVFPDYYKLLVRRKRKLNFAVEK